MHLFQYFLSRSTGGASDDYAKGRAHIPYAATVELPGDDRWVLLLEEESFDGLMLWEEDTVTN